MVSRGVSMKFQGRSKKACRVLQGSFNGVSRRINECFNDVSSGFQWHLKEVHNKLGLSCAKLRPD